MTARSGAARSGRAAWRGAATRVFGAAVLAGSAVLLLACGNAPPVPDWQLEASGSLERAQQAWLSGNSRVAAVEFARARAALARTGRIDLMARLELAQCATRVASLVFEPCSGYEALAQDAAAPERAYARYLAGEAAAADLALLPAPQRQVAAANGGAALSGLADPLSRLVAAGVLLQTRRSDPATIALALETASAQGWRRPLLAWLGVQAQRADAAGDGAESARIRRRIARILENEPPVR